MTPHNFQKDFRKLIRHLSTGQMIQVTEQGKPVGFFTKVRSAPRPMPDFAANLAHLPYSVTEGERALRQYLRESLS